MKLKNTENQSSSLIHFTPTSRVHHLTVNYNHDSTLHDSHLPD